jgi:ParB-like chromosome segregation protein Spo0J
LEEAGIFGYTSGELERLAESVEKDGFLKPILITLDGNIL